VFATAIADYEYLHAALQPAFGFGTEQANRKKENHAPQFPPGGHDRQLLTVVTASRCARTRFFDRLREESRFDLYVARTTAQNCGNFGVRKQNLRRVTVDNSVGWSYTIGSDIVKNVTIP
jgi:hypothetical protein